MGAIFFFAMASRTSVVIDDFHVVGVGFLPPEANPPLIVDADAVLSPSIAREDSKGKGYATLRRPLWGLTLRRTRTPNLRAQALVGKGIGRELV